MHVCFYIEEKARIQRAFCCLKIGIVFTYSYRFFASFRPLKTTKASALKYEHDAS